MSTVAVSLSSSSSLALAVMVIQQRQFIGLVHCLALFIQQLEIVMDWLRN